MPYLFVFLAWVASVAANSWTFTQSNPLVLCNSSACHRFCGGVDARTVEALCRMRKQYGQGFAPTRVSGSFAPYSLGCTGSEATVNDCQVVPSSPCPNSFALSVTCSASLVGSTDEQRRIPCGRPRSLSAAFSALQTSGVRGRAGYAAFKQVQPHVALPVGAPIWRGPVSLFLRVKVTDPSRYIVRAGQQGGTHVAAVAGTTALYPPNTTGFVVGVHFTNTSAGVGAAATLRVMQNAPSAVVVPSGGGGVSFLDGKWHSVAVTFNPRGYVDQQYARETDTVPAAVEALLYVDGKVAGREVTTRAAALGPRAVEVSVLGHSLRILADGGGLTQGGGGVAEEVVGGLAVDEIRLYRAVLTPSEVGVNHAAVHVDPATWGLAHYWPVVEEEVGLLAEGAAVADYAVALGATRYPGWARADGTVVGAVMSGADGGAWTCTPTPSLTRTPTWVQTFTSVPCLETVPTPSTVTVKVDEADSGKLRVSVRAPSTDTEVCGEGLVGVEVAMVRVGVAVVGTGAGSGFEQSGSGQWVDLGSNGVQHNVTIVRAGDGVVAGGGARRVGRIAVESEVDVRGGSRRSLREAFSLESFILSDMEVVIDNPADGHSYTLAVSYRTAGGVSDWSKMSGPFTAGRTSEVQRSFRSSGVAVLVPEPLVAFDGPFVRNRIASLANVPSDRVAISVLREPTAEWLSDHFTPASLRTLLRASEASHGPEWRAGSGAVAAGGGPSQAAELPGVVNADDTAPLSLAEEVGGVSALSAVLVHVLSSTSQADADTAAAQLASGGVASGGGLSSNTTQGVVVLASEAAARDLVVGGVANLAATDANDAWEWWTLALIIVVGVALLVFAICIACLVRVCYRRRGRDVVGDPTASATKSLVAVEGVGGDGVGNLELNSASTAAAAGTTVGGGATFASLRTASQPSESLLRSHSASKPSQAAAMSDPASPSDVRGGARSSKSNARSVKSSRSNIGSSPSRSRSRSKKRAASSSRGRSTPLSPVRTVQMAEVEGEGAGGRQSLQLASAAVVDDAPLASASSQSARVPPASPAASLRKAMASSVNDRDGAADTKAPFVYTGDESTALAADEAALVRAEVAAARFESLRDTSTPPALVEGAAAVADATANEATLRHNVRTGVDTSAADLLSTLSRVQSAFVAEAAVEGVDHNTVARLQTERQGAALRLLAARRAVACGCGAVDALAAADAAWAAAYLNIDLTASRAAGSPSALAAAAVQYPVYDGESVAARSVSEASRFSSPRRRRSVSRSPRRASARRRSATPQRLASPLFRQQYASIAVTDASEPPTERASRTPSISSAHARDAESPPPLDGRRPRSPMVPTVPVAPRFETDARAEQRRAAASTWAQSHPEAPSGSVPMSPRDMRSGGATSPSVRPPWRPAGHADTFRQDALRALPEPSPSTRHLYDCERATSIPTVSPQSSRSPSASPRKRASRSRREGPSEVSTPQAAMLQSILRPAVAEVPPTPKSQGQSLRPLYRPSKTTASLGLAKSQPLFSSTTSRGKPSSGSVGVPAEPLSASARERATTRTPSRDTRPLTARKAKGAGRRGASRDPSRPPSASMKNVTVTNVNALSAGAAIGGSGGVGAPPNLSPRSAGASVRPRTPVGGESSAPRAAGRRRRGEVEVSSPRKGESDVIEGDVPALKLSVTVAEGGDDAQGAGEGSVKEAGKEVGKEKVKKAKTGGEDEGSEGSDAEISRPLRRRRSRRPLPDDSD